MAERNFYSAAVLRIQKAWGEGERARNWSKDDLDQALVDHRHQWQEVFVRLLCAYHSFDSGNGLAALGHLTHAESLARDVWPSNDPFRLELKLLLAFVSARCGKPLPTTDRLLTYAQVFAAQEPNLQFSMARTRAAYLLAVGDESALDAIDAADRWIRGQPDAESDNIQAELDWLHAMREDYYNGRRAQSPEPT